MNLYLDLDFTRHFSKENFFFGVANAPYLCEGGYNTPDGPKNSYGYFEAQGTVPRSGEATRYWDNYAQHISMASKLGLTAFRMGVDWSRVQPSTELASGPAPEWDSAALDRYADILGEVQRHQMDPIVTLHHFTHPAWLGKTLWLREDAADLATDYELRVVEELGKRLVDRGLAPLGHFSTFNELNLIPLLYFSGPLRDKTSADAGPHSFQAAYDNILSAHVRIYDGIKDLYQAHGWVEPIIGFGIASQSPYEVDKLMLDIVRLRTEGISRADASVFLGERRAQWTSRLAGLAKRQLNDDQYELYQEQATDVQQCVDPARMVKTLDALYASKTPSKLDYISANVYEPFGMVRAFGDPAKWPKWWELSIPQWWQLAVDGDIYRTMILAYNDGNTDLPMFMGENSIAYEQPRDGEAVARPDGWTRERYLKTYLMEMIRCMAEGVPIRGYLYWSLVDDFEWEAGFSPRLGLYNYDYTTHEIQTTDGQGEPAGDIYARLINSLRSGSKAQIREAFVNAYLPGHAQS